MRLSELSLLEMRYFRIIRTKCQFDPEMVDLRDGGAPFRASSGRKMPVEGRNGRRVGIGIGHFGVEVAFAGEIPKRGV